jgi:hypothetical protein
MAACTASDRVVRNNLGAASCAGKDGLEMAQVNKNEGLPCEFCGERLKRLQLDVSPDKKTVNVRINWAWTKGEVAKQLKGLHSLIKSMAEGLDP